MKAADFRGATANAFWRRLYQAPVSQAVDGAESASPSGCWLWPGSPSTSGYGRLTVRGRSYQTHRIAFCLTHPQVVLTPEMHIIHACNVKLCCRPYHLMCADAATNMRQAAIDGLLPKGERHACAKLTDLAVVLIIVRWLAGESPKNIAPDYGVLPTAIYNILAGQNWKHITVPLFRILCPGGTKIGCRMAAQHGVQLKEFIVEQ